MLHHHKGKDVVLPAYPAWSLGQRPHSAAAGTHSEPYQARLNRGPSAER